MGQGEYGGNTPSEEKDIIVSDETIKKEGELPIIEYEQEIRETIRNNSTSIIVGETGSGKTTQIPLMLLEELGPNEKIAITQPRRVAARSVSSYVASNVGCHVGEDVGYQIRFEDHTSEGTRINFMTDGILLRKMQEDPLLSEYSAVMVDEAHERSLNIDITLGLLKRLQRKRERAGLEPIKIIVTSATLEKEKFAEYFNEAPTVEVPGRLYPVDVHNMEPGEKGDFLDTRGNFDYTKAAADRVRKITEERKEGDVLIFMPGKMEIDKTIDQIRTLELDDVETLPLYGSMSPEDQDKIFSEIKKRKIIVSTNIAETSITVPGVKHVIDSGLIKQKEFDPRTGISSLATRFHAKSGCKQRMGRAGRLASGECWQLYTEEEFEQRQDFQTPEMKRSDLAHVVLMMKDMKIEDVRSFEFIDPPPRETIEQAIEELITLGALDENENITAIGETMADLPLEPRIARMVIEADKHNCVETVCTIAAFLGNRSVFVRPKEKELEADQSHAKFKDTKSDFLTLLKVWKEYETNGYDYKWARENFLHTRVLNEVSNIRYQLFRALKRNGIRATENEDPEIIGKSIASGLVGNLMIYDGQHSYRKAVGTQRDFYIHPGSATFGYDPKFFVPAEIMETSRKFARNCQTVKPEWIPEIAPHLVEERSQGTYYDSESGTVKKRVDFYLKGQLDSFLEQFQDTKGDEAIDTFAEALMAGKIEGVEAVEQNKVIIEYLNNLWIKAGGKI